MKRVNNRITSKKLHIILLNVIAERDPSEILFYCNKKTIDRLSSYKEEFIPPIWTEASKKFLGIQVVEKSDVEDNIVMVSSSEEKIFWPEK